MLLDADLLRSILAESNRVLCAGVAGMSDTRRSNEVDKRGGGDGMAYLNAAQDVVIFLCNAHQLLFTTVLVQRLGRRQRLLHVYSLRVRHDVRHALKQQIIGALDG